MFIYIILINKQMTTKEQIIMNIKEWLQCDNDINELQKSIRDIKHKKKLLTDQIVNVMKTNEIDCFDINDGKLIYSQNKTKAALSKQHLYTCLEKYFEKSHDPEIIQDLGKFILDSREVKTKEIIRRKIQKKITD